jgi:Protein of unknown function (DUF4230)
MNSSSPASPKRNPQFSFWQIAIIVLVVVIATALVTRVLSSAPGPTIALITPSPTLLPSHTPVPAIPTQIIAVPATPTQRVVATATSSATSTRTPAPTPTATSTPTPSPTPITVIDKIQGLGRLETAHYSMQTVVEMTSDAPLQLPFPVPPLFTQQKMLMIAAGDIIAGFDLTKIAPGDILVEGTKVQMTLPPAEILVTRIDNQHTYVYLDQKPFYLPNDKTLEGKARQAAEDQLTKYALEHEILAQAEEYGKYRLEALLRALGFTQVDIRVSTPPANPG